MSTSSLEAVLGFLYAGLPLTFQVIIHSVSKSPEYEFKTACFFNVITAWLFCGIIMKVWFQKQCETKGFWQNYEVSSKTKNRNKDE